MDLAGEINDSHLVVNEVVATGGFGTVYKGEAGALAAAGWVGGGVARPERVAGWWVGGRVAGRVGHRSPGWPDAHKPAVDGYVLWPAPEAGLPLALRRHVAPFPP